MSRKRHDHHIEFYSYRSDLSRLVEKFQHVIENVSDFWAFVQKYEEVERKKASKNTQHEPTASHSGSKLILPKTYDVQHTVNVDFTISDDDMQSCLSIDKRHRLRKNLSKFTLLIGVYINFKQKEKLSKLKKIRNGQQNLPVFQFKDQIIETVQNEKVVIIAGDTGCGKSTQIPQFLWQAGYNRIACTQPRRIACISLSKRVAKESLSEFTSGVGYQIRFERHRNRETKILFITEGLLLRQTSNEETLDYDVIVLDEVHERHLHGDFLLGIMKCLLYQRPDLKLVLMSATINIELFSSYFGESAKVIQVPGRLYPITLQYYPIIDVDANSDKFDPGPYIRILQLIDQKYPKKERGDVLMFLSGTKEITAVVEAAQQYNEKVNSWCILPLHSSLSLAEQDKVFDYPPEGFRKCVVSTNIAETSVTIDGIRFVVDSGKVKEMSYDPTCKLQRLKEFWVSKASAEQRKGRAGRTGPGVCYRLYSEDDYSAMNQYTTPEIQRVSLDSVLLQMISMGLPDVRKFPFIEPPDPSSIDNAILDLRQHGAIDSEEKLTVIGKTLAKLPVDIQLGKMLIMGSLFYQVEPILSLAAALSVQSPFTNRAFRDIEMQDLRKDLESDHGDPITLLNIFREWLQMKQESTQGRGSSSYQTKKWCKKRGLEEQRFYEMIKLRNQFKDLLFDCNLINEDCTPIKSKEELTSAERAIRHGELKQLRKLKREYENETSNKPKILKIDKSMEVERPDYEEEDTSTDIRDIEFRMRNNPSQVQNLLDGSTATSYKDLMMLKVIFSSAIYPQIAIADEFNSSKTVKDQLFHTAEKPFVSLHPNCFFAFHPHVVQLEQSDIEHPPGFRSKFQFSSRHQVLFYMSLLETTKVYLCNALRMPAAQSVLLFSQEIHCNKNFTKIICDNWIEIQFATPLSGEKFLLKVCNIRQIWEKLLDKRLQGENTGRNDEDLMDLILGLLRADICYSIRRLLPADLKVAFKGRQFDSYDVLPTDNPFNEDFTIEKNEHHGGIKVTPYLTYDSVIIDDENVDVLEKWKCDRCQVEIILPPLERLIHIKNHEKENNKGNDVLESLPSGSKKPNSKLYKCDICQKQMYLTPTEILRHVKDHKTSNT
ncbi:probable ATP-dependent RNA helicase DHX34 [Planococcus citri]|uniref:probable ATP-dependent RNA helicase DHX34 n=1 Tax=Planococcus citri TaxID=170843 RepID=UPI0031F7C93F